MPVEQSHIHEKLLSWSSFIFSKSHYDNLRDALTFVGGSLEPKNIDLNLLAWYSSFSSYIKENPIMVSFQTENGIGTEAVETYVNIPCLGSISLDVFLFSTSAILSRAYMFWRNRRNASQRTRSCTTTKKTFRQELHKGPPSPPVKSTIVKGYKDEGLYKIIGECKTVKKSLRKVTHPELMRKEKRTKLALQNIRTKIKGNDSSDGYLGMSPGSLQDARRSLKQTRSDQIF